MHTRLPSQNQRERYVGVDGKTDGVYWISGSEKGQAAGFNKNGKLTRCKCKRFLD